MEPEPRSSMKTRSSWRVSLIHLRRSFFETKQAESMRPITAQLVVIFLLYITEQSIWEYVSKIKHILQLFNNKKCLFQYRNFSKICQLKKIRYQQIMQGHQDHPIIGKDTHSPSSQNLKVLTLNYCGIMNNPFQFYSQSNWVELSEISKIFDELVRAHYKLEPGSKWKWGMGKVEQKVRIGRYSPSFDPTVGIHESGTRFVTLDEFRERWDAAFKKMIEQIGQKFEEEHIKTTFNYDLIYFHTLLRYVFHKTDLEELLKEDPNVYRENLRKFYEQSFLDEKRKLEKVKATLLKLDFDILFLQEYSPLLEEFIAQEKDKFFYQTDSDAEKDTIIVVKRTSFKTIESIDKVMTKEQKQAMSWSNKTSFLLVDNIILINAHLSSGKEKNGTQMASLRQTLCDLKDSKKGYHIILAGDLNSYLAPDENLEKRFAMYPSDEKAITTIKMRTMAQGQYEKGNMASVESKDKIITDLPIINNSGSITFIDGHTPATNNSYVPTDEHPFDHFLVACTVARN